MVLGRPSAVAQSFGGPWLQFHPRPNLACRHLILPFRQRTAAYYRFADIAGKNGTVIVFICNHCPYVKAVIDRMTADARALKEEGIGFVAISSNDAKSYPEDSFDNMKSFAKAHAFPFPYLYDETQTVARAYGAVCTPDFYGFDKERKLLYRGRLDDGTHQTAAAQCEARTSRSHAPHRQNR